MERQGRGGPRAPRAVPAISVTPSVRSPGRLLREAHVRLRAGLVRALREAGHELSAEGWGVLSLLAEHDELQQLEIGELLGKDRHHTSRLIDSLEEQGLVARTSDDQDRRVKRVGLTPAGRAARSTLARVITRYLEDAFEGIPQSDYDAFIRCLEHLIARLDAQTN